MNAQKVSTFGKNTGDDFNHEHNAEQPVEEMIEEDIDELQIDDSPVKRQSKKKSINKEEKAGSTTDSTE